MPPCLSRLTLVVPERQWLQIRRPVVGKPLASCECLAPVRVILQNKEHC